MAATVQPWTVRLATNQLRSGPDNCFMSRLRVRTVSTSASSGIQRSSSGLLNAASDEDLLRSPAPVGGEEVCLGLHP